MIHTPKGKFLKEQTMKSFEACLLSEKFVCASLEHNQYRPHRPDGVV
ncbi:MULTISPECIES: hypothetical protein [unclassified Dysgonomonas]|nr:MULTISPECIES: hypothetical protein [unclassified Dysgonomonas]